MDNKSPFYSVEELKSLGFSAVGEKVSVSRLCRFYGVSGTLGSNVRIDDFCIFKGRIEVGSFVHIAAFCMISGVSGTVRMEDFSGLAARTSIYTGTDDYSADMLTNPMVPKEYRHDITGEVTLKRGCIIGAHSVILPNVVVGEFASVGAFGLVYRNIPDGSVYVSPVGKMTVKRTKDTTALHKLADKVIQKTGN